MGTLDIHHRGDSWGYAFACVDARIGFDETLHLVKSAIDMYLDNLDKKDVRGVNYEGRITNTKKYYQLGAFGGICFKAELDVDSKLDVDSNNGDNKANLSFLILDYIDPIMN